MKQINVEGTRYKDNLWLNVYDGTASLDQIFSKRSAKNERMKSDAINLLQLSVQETVHLQTTRKSIPKNYGISCVMLEVST